MTEHSFFSKDLGRGGQELLIRAMAADEKGGWRPVTFGRDRVDYVAGIDDKTSAIALVTGAKIAVAMAYEELEQKVYCNEEPLLDLRSVTGPAAVIVVPALAQDFETAAQLKAKAEAPVYPMVNKPLKIAVFVRQAQEQNFQMHIFVDSQIDWSLVEGEEGRNGKLTKLPLLHGKGPFGEKEMIIDMPRAAFMEVYGKAKMEGKAELDLRDWTRRRDPDAHKPPYR
ncbi:MAG: hypothetical protein ACAH80_12230 [Alphaproteobacteria bacterium]